MRKLDHRGTFWIYLLLFGVICWGATAARAQSTTPRPLPTPVQRSAPINTATLTPPGQTDPLENEMLARLARRRQKAEYAEQQERAAELGRETQAALAAHQRTTTSTSTGATAEYRRSLQRIEKLTRQLREYYGGEQDETTDASNSSEVPLTDMEKLERLGHRISEQAHTTSRFEVPAALIADCNELLRVLKRLRQE